MKVESEISYQNENAWQLIGKSLISSYNNSDKVELTFAASYNSSIQQTFRLNKDDKDYILGEYYSLSLVTNLLK